METSRIVSFYTVLVTVTGALAGLSLSSVLGVGDSGIDVLLIVVFALIGGGLGMVIDHERGKA